MASLPLSCGRRSHARVIWRPSRKVRDYIFAGDIFQANLSQRFEVASDESAWSFYTRLRQRNAAPFAAFLDFPEVVVVSASPERFLRVDANGVVETRPIKGTRPRGVGPEHDAALGQALAESAKDRAENLMIVDLMRNDLSRVCAPNSVRVSELFSLEHYATVHHLVSTVVGELGPGTDAIDLLRAAFPGGSITGAPEVAGDGSDRGARAVEARRLLRLDRLLERDGRARHQHRHPNGGLQDGRVYFSAGGGIVADSDPEQEYLETLDKARAMIDALAERMTCAEPTAEDPSEAARLSNAACPDRARRAISAMRTASGERARPDRSTRCAGAR